MLYKEKRISFMFCCGTNNEIDIYLFPLISINIEKLKLESLNGIINSLAEPFSCSCIICSFNSNETIKENIFYHTCKQTIIKDLGIPDILFLIFYLSTENDLDFKQYINLINLNNSYKKFIEDEFTYKNNIFILSETINQTNINHYTVCILNIKREINGLLKNKNYYYDEFTNDNKIIEFNKQIN